jgi:ribosome assembly protein 4
LPLPPDVRPQGQPLHGHKKWVTSLAFEPLHADPSCTRLASSSKDHTVRQGQGYPEKQMHLLLRTAYSHALSLDRPRLLLPILYRLPTVLVQIKVWNLRTGACETTISGHTDSVECVRWGGVGLLYTCSRDRTIKVWAIDGSGT